jgi:putative DNA primase/helicase
MRPSAAEIATGRWPGLLASFGIESQFLRNKHGPCPICGGKDRFRFDDRESRGTWICNQCGSGDGYKLLELFKGWTFKEAAREVQLIAGVVRQTVNETVAPENAQKLAAVKKIWQDSIRIAPGDPAFRYIRARAGEVVIPTSLRFHPALAYVDDGEVTHYPALVAVVMSAEGKGVAVHRIYLTAEGAKAPVESQKKLLAGGDISGAAVRIGDPGEEIGIAEGIETALVACRKFGFPVWSAITAGGMEKWRPPDTVKRVTVFGDNDRSFTGQASAYSLAKKLKAAGFDVSVKIPEKEGTDWADE